MIVTIVHVYVKPEFIPAFIEVTRENYENSIQETGNFRFDVLQDSEDSGKFVLYEAYESQEDILAHRETPHYLKWRDTVADWMIKPRQGIKHNMLFPTQKLK